jgi:hypothetical protein
MKKQISQSQFFDNNSKDFEEEEEESNQDRDMDSDVLMRDTTQCKREHDEDKQMHDAPV